MSSIHVKLEAEKLLHSTWDVDAFRAWVSDQKAKGLACKACVTKPSPKCQCHRPSYYQGKRGRRAYRKFIFTQKFGISAATYVAWVRQWTKKKRTKKPNRKTQQLTKSNSVVIPTSSVPGIPTRQPQKPAVPSAPEPKATILSDSSSDRDVDKADDNVSFTSSDYDSLSESESVADEDDEDNEDEASRAEAPDSQIAFRDVPNNEAPSTERADSEPQNDVILTLAKSLVPDYSMEIDDDTSDELLAIVLETRNRFTLVLQRNEARAREAELLEEIRVLKEQVANSGSTQKALKTRLAAIVQSGKTIISRLFVSEFVVKVACATRSCVLSIPPRASKTKPKDKDVKT